MLLTDETGSGTATLAYSAFGEPVGDAAALPTRYQFSGGHGYESGLLTLPAAPGTAPLTFQHLGARWYQPNTGRFIQRDPIGLAGGMNVYAYCGNNPTVNVDPDGRGPQLWPRRKFKGPQIVNKKEKKIVVHWYTRKGFLWWTHEEYSHAQEFPLHIDDGPQTNCQLWNDVGKCTEDKNKADATVVTEAAEHLDRETRRNVWKWMWRGRPRFRL